MILISGIYWVWYSKKKSISELLSMGNSVIAECKCGYNRIFLIGCGMMDFNKSTCYFPCLCEKCREIVRANVLSRYLKCPSCKTTEIIPYDDPKVIGKKGENRVVDWGVYKKLGRILRITDGEYYCPKCGENNLQFRDGGVFWDWLIIFWMGKSELNTPHFYSILPTIDPLVILQRTL